MNTITASCGHPVAAIGAPHSDARRKCERDVCRDCAKLIHCMTHNYFALDCHWCHVDKEAFMRMTNAERKAMYQS